VKQVNSVRFSSPFYFDELLNLLFVPLGGFPMKRVLAIPLFLLALSGGAFSAHAADRTHTNCIGIEFLRIPAGTFTMGADRNFENAYRDEAPPHQVTISQPFYLGRYEVTQAQWMAVMGNDPSRFKGRRNHPVENVSWNDVQTFIARLNRKEGTNKYRLPTEAEWEYAARAGTLTQYSFGDDADSLEQYAWYEDISGNKTHPVGQKEANPWGLYDMHGNVWEWVQDWYGEDVYAKSAASDPSGLAGGSIRVVRGGSWNGDARYLRSAARHGDSPEKRHGYIGFRLAFSPGYY
jgi:formylglycine-generating enzyme required for sulfatase activity